MAKPQTIIRDGSGTRTATYQLPPGLFQYIESILVELDNGAAVAVRPTLKVETVNGQVMATKRQGESVPAGDTGTATWALRLTDEGGGIEFNKVNVGGYLWIEINDTHFLNGVMFDVLQGAFKVLVDDAAVNGEVSLGAPYVEIFTNGANLRLLDSGETFFNCDSGASWSFGDFALATTAASGSGGIGFDAPGADSDFNVNAGHDVRFDSGRRFTVIAAGLFRVNADSGDIEFTTDSQILCGGELLLQADTDVQLSSGAQSFFKVAPTVTTAKLAAGGKLEVQNSAGSPIFRVNEDGSLQGKTGATLTFDL